MTKEDNKKERRSWWVQFLISVIGTAIGVGLTFAVMKRTTKQYIGNGLFRHAN
ncbi:MAG: hypothetical protein J6W12_00835 [Bacteroidales bacterium]|nr:hypothetical protein [Bacteroidales bacterium]